jgi:hypothetical protein
VRTNRVVELIGLDQEKVGLDTSDVETGRILEEERQKFKNKQHPQVLTFKEYAALVGDKSNDFPFRGYEDVIIAGPKDGGVVVWGSLKGYEPALGKTVRQIDDVKSVTLVGPDAPETREEFLKKIRPRYALPGNELPRETNPDATYTTQGVKGRGRTLRRKGDSIVLQVQKADGNTQELKGDLIILSTGFEDDSEKVYSSLNNEIIRDKEEIRSRAIDVIEHPGSVIYYKGGARKSLEIIDTVQTDQGRELIYKETFRNGRTQESQILLQPNDRLSFKDKTILVDDLTQAQLFVRINLVPNQVSRIEYRSGRAPELKFVYDPDNPGQAIALQRGELPIYVAGAAARLPLTARIKGAAAKIPENTASFFATSESVTALARVNAEKDNEQPVKKRPLSLTAQPLTREVEIFSRPAPVNKKYFFDIERARAGLPTDIQLTDHLKLAIGDILANYRFPLETKKLL